MAITNSEVMEQVVSNMPTEEATRLQGLSSVEAYKVMKEYPTTANSFINTLTNKVTKSLIYSKIFNNPLKKLKKGTLEYGDSIEQLFVEMAQVKGFTGHWEEANGTEEADLIRKLVPTVSAMYIQVNVDYKLKTTVMDKALRKAFMQEGGLANLVGQIVASITSSAEYKEFNLTKTTLTSLVEDAKQIQSIAENGDVVLGSIQPGVIKQTPYIKKTTDTRDLSKCIKETIGYMKFPSKKYNLAKKLVWSQPTEMFLITTPTIIADLDVNVLANAFNVSMADFNTSTLLLDEMPKGIFKKTGADLTDGAPTEITDVDTIESDVTKVPKAILVSKDLLQIWDTHQGNGTFHNPQGEYTNHFANREGIFATCLFENMAIFY